MARCVHSLKKIKGALPTVVDALTSQVVQDPFSHIDVWDIDCGTGGLS
jgi:hypothetical protein